MPQSSELGSPTRFVNAPNNSVVLTDYGSSDQTKELACSWHIGKNWVHRSILLLIVLPCSNKIVRVC